MTGGYLFHRRLAERAPDNGAEMRFVSIPDLPLPWAMAAGPAWLLAPATRSADLLVLDSIAASAAAPWLGRVRAPVVGMLHQPPGGIDAPHVQRRFRAPFDRHAYRACAVLMVASDWLAAQLVAAGLAGERLRVVAPGKDLDVAGGGPTSEDEVGGVDRASLRRGRLMAAVCVANWLPRKGIVELLDAVAGLPDDVVTLHLVGDTATRGGYARHVRERIDHADLRDRVVVHGLVSPAAVHRMYRTVDAFVLPSFEEPYGTVWGEAMAAGLPGRRLAGGQPAIPGRSRPRRRARARRGRPGTRCCHRRAGPRPSASRAARARRPRPRSGASDVGRDGDTLLHDHPGGVVRAPNTCSKGPVRGQGGRRVTHHRRPVGQRMPRRQPIRTRSREDC